MKIIEIKCFDSGYATLNTKDLHISNENKASLIKIDFSSTNHALSAKWVDIITIKGTSLRYELGSEQIVEVELENILTVPGLLTITPFVIDGERKIKYIPHGDVIIRKQPDAGDSEAPKRDDYIFEIVNRINQFETDVEITFSKTRNEMRKIGETIITRENGKVSTIENPYSTISISRKDNLVETINEVYVIPEIMETKTTFVRTNGKVSKIIKEEV